MDIRERLVEYLAFKNIKKSHFEKSIKVSNGYVNNIVKNIPSSKLSLIKELYSDLNLDWLQFGEGEMIQMEGKSLDNTSVVRESNALYNTEGVTQVDSDNYIWVEYNDLSASAGPLGGNVVDDLPRTKKRLVPKEYESGEYLVVKVDGDSMDDGSKYSIPDGTEILIKKYYLNPGDKLPIRGNLFVIVAKDGRALKQVIEHNLIDEYILCHSYNPNYSDYKIPIEDIIEIYIYRKITSSRPPVRDIKK